MYFIVAACSFQYSCYFFKKDLLIGLKRPTNTSTKLSIKVLTESRFAQKWEVIYNASKLTKCKSDRILGTKQYFWSCGFQVLGGHFYLFIWLSGFLFIRSSGIGPHSLGQQWFQLESKYSGIRIVVFKWLKPV